MSDRRRGRARGAHQLHGAARPARRPAPQRHRRAVHRAIGVDRRARQPTSSPAWTAISRSSRTSTSTATREVEDARPRKGKDVSYRGAVQLRGRSLRPPARSDRRRRRTSTPRSASCRGPTSGATSRRPASARGRPAIPTIRKYYFDGSFNYTTDNDNHLESRQALGAFRVELQNSDAFHVEYSRDYEFLRRPFQVADTRADSDRRLRLQPRAGRLQPRAAASPVGHRVRRRRRLLRRDQEDRVAPGAARRDAAARHRAEHLAELDRARVRCASW